MVRLIENIDDSAARSAREAALIAFYRARGEARCNKTQ
jgi:hypothetical protein